MPYGVESLLSAHKETKLTDSLLSQQQHYKVNWLCVSVVRFQMGAHHIGGTGGSSFLYQDLHNIKMTHK